MWELEIRSGAFCLDVGNARLESTLAVNDGAWHHLAVVLPASAERLEDAVLYVDGTIQNVTSTANPVISTGDDYDVIIGSDLLGNNFDGTIDEIRLYERGLSLSEVKSIYLDGTVVFTTSSVAQPPVVELSRVVAEANASVTIVGELLSVDQNDPVVRIYYGLEDGGFSQQDWNNSFVDVNGGSPVVLGDFNATIIGLTPGERYYFRAFAQSADGVDWSSGDPEVKSGLLGYWRMDETNGSVLIDSIAPFHNAGLSVLEENRTRTTGYLGRGLYLSGNPDYVNLDLNNTGYLEQSFDGRSVSIWIKPDQEFYTGPTVTKYESLVGYYNFDNQVGSKVYDLSINESLADLINGSSLTSGQYGQSLNLDGTNDKVTIPTSGGMASLNQGSHTISMWIKPNQVNTGTYTEGRLHAHGFLRGIDNIYYPISRQCLP